MRRNWRTKVVANVTAGALLGLLGLCACSPDFDPFNRVASLRVLGMKSEPPTPSPAESATYSALVYGLPDDPPPTYEWTWCPFSGVAEDGYQCAIDGTALTDELLATLLATARAQLGLDGGTPPPSLHLGFEPTATLNNFIEPAILAALCTGQVMGLPPRDCSDGYPFKVRLKVSTAGERPDTVDAVVTGHWSLTPPPADGDPPPDPSWKNTNPEVPQLFARQGEAWQPLTDDAALTLPREKATPLQARLSLASAQVYEGFDADFKPATLTERLFYTWFVESGSTDDARTSYYPDRTPFEDLQKNTWAPGLKKNYPRDTARIFVVIHDNRGGVNWTQGTVNLEPTP